MKKILGLFVAGILVSASMVGCSGSTAEGDITKTPEPATTGSSTTGTSNPPATTGGSTEKPAPPAGTAGSGAGAPPVPKPGDTGSTPN